MSSSKKLEWIVALIVIALLILGAMWLLGYFGEKTISGIAPTAGRLGELALIA
jgi:hypothetical protein